MAQSGTTNRELEIAIVRIEGKLDLMNADMASVKEDMSTVKKSLNGNGKAGLIDDHRELKRCFDVHLQEVDVAKKLANDKKEKLSTRTWAVIMVLITQTAGLLFLFLRPI